MPKPLTPASRHCDRPRRSPRRALRLLRSFLPSAFLPSAFLPATFLLAACLAMPAAAQELRVLSSDASGCTVEYRPRLRASAIQSDGVAFTVFEADRVGHANANDAGAPDLLARNETLVLPARAGHRVTVLAAEYRDSAGVLLLPVPSFPGADGEPVYATDPAYARGAFLPERTAALDGIGVARDHIMGRLSIAPFQYNAAQRVARLYTRIVVRVDFAPPDADVGARPARGAAAAGADFAGGELNEPQRALWSVRAPAVLRKAGAASLAAGDWYRIDIAEEGVYRLTRAWFKAAGIDIDAVDPRSIRLFGGGGRELPASLSAPRPDDLQEIAVEVAGGDDGRLDDGDAVIFYGRGLTGFAYDSAARRYGHYIHRYAAANSYLLTMGGQAGKRMAVEASASDPNAYAAPWFTGKEFAEDEVVNILASGKLWLSRKIDPRMAQGNSLSYMKKLQDIVPSQPVLYRAMLYSRSDLGTSNLFTLSDGVPLGTVPMGTVDFSTDRDYIAASSGAREFSRGGDLADGRSMLTVTYSASDPDRNLGGYVDWLEWYYARSFNAVGDALGFSAPDTTATVAYELNGFSNSDVRVYRVTDPADVRRVTPSEVSGGTVRFQSPTATGRPEQYHAVAAAAMKTPGAPVRIANSDLRTTAGSELLIITAPDFVDTAAALKAHRERPGEDYIATRIVPLDAVYNEFNGGLADPTAIRNFLAYAMAQWQVRPRYVLLLGDGHYDYRDYTTSGERSIVPVWESENSTHLIASYPSDDYYVQVVGDDALVDIACGRLPVQTTEEAANVIAKIIAYEAQPDLDPWRNLVTFVADDGKTTKGDDYNVHTAQSETLSDALPADLERKKINIVSYTTENTAYGRRKPGAFRAIVDQINEGALVTNYTGHGSDCVWAHEQVFLCDGSMPLLVNPRRLTFVSAATCTFGLYDRPNVSSGTEQLLRKSDGGSIGGLSSPRVVFSGQNSSFNLAFFEYLFRRGVEADGRMKRVGDAIYGAKHQWYGDAGYEKFHLFCDPSMRLARPRYRAAVDSILVGGVPITGDSAQIKALSKVTIHASVRRADSSVWSDFTGAAEIRLYDADRTVAVPEWNNWSYSIRGGLLFRGEATIAGGRFSSTFIVPRDISYENNNGRLTIYFDNGAVDGAGYDAGFRVGGSDSSGAADNRGPDIALYLDTRAFRSGDVTNEHPLLIADLYDENGINTTGLGIGHSIETWIDGVDPSLVLNDYYTGERDSYQRGVVQYQLSNLAAGAHTLRLRAWDIFNNSSTAEIAFTVALASEPTVRDVYPYPNPASDGTVFTFQHNLPAPIDVDVAIYTLAGRRIRSLQERGVEETFVRIPWDGRDEEGDRPANGVYFFKIQCRAPGGTSVETIGRIALLR